jgi:hypothetical protein
MVGFRQPKDIALLAGEARTIKFYEKTLRAHGGAAIGAFRVNFTPNQCFTCAGDNS